MSKLLIYRLTDGQGIARSLMNPILTAIPLAPVATQLEPLIDEIAASVSGGSATPADMGRYNNALATLNASAPVPFPDFATSSTALESAASDTELETTALVNLVDPSIPPADVNQRLVDASGAVNTAVTVNLPSALTDIDGSVPLGTLAADGAQVQTSVGIQLTDIQTNYGIFFPAAPVGVNIAGVNADFNTELPIAANALDAAIGFLEPNDVPFNDVRDNAGLLELIANTYRNGDGAGIPGLRDIVAAKAGVSPNWPAYTGLDPLTDDILLILEYLDVSVN